MIGNDIVDVDDDDSRPDGRHPRLDARVFAAIERSLLVAADEPQRLRCRLWAAKESAFKLLRRSQPGVVFSPPRFVVRPCGAGAATVEVAGRRLAVRFDEGEGFVHAVASGAMAGGAIVLSGVARHEMAGSGARTLAIGAIAARLDEDPRRFAVGKEGRVPVLLRDGRRVAGCLSLSHHGRFVAYAWSGAADPD